MEPVQPRKTEGAGRTTGTSAHIVALDGFQLTSSPPSARRCRLRGKGGDSSSETLILGISELVDRPSMGHPGKK